MNSLPTHTIVKCVVCQRPAALAGIRLRMAGIAPGPYCPRCCPQWLRADYQAEEREHQAWLAEQEWMEGYYCA